MAELERLIKQVSLLNVILHRVDASDKSLNRGKNSKAPPYRTTHIFPYNNNNNINIRLDATIIIFNKIIIVASSRMFILLYQ